MFYFWTMLFSFSLYSLRFDGIVQPICWHVAEVFQKLDFLKGSYAECQLGTQKGFSYLCSFFESMSFKKDFYDLGNETGQIATTTTTEATLKPQFR